MCSRGRSTRWPRAPRRSPPPPRGPRAGRGRARRAAASRRRARGAGRPRRRWRRPRSPAGPRGPERAHGPEGRRCLFAHMQLRAHSSVAAVAEAWDELADRTGAAPWLRPGWFAAYLESFGRGAFEVLTVHDGGELVAVCPTERHGATRTAAANWHSPTFA